MVKSSESEFLNLMLHRTALCFSPEEIERVKRATIGIAGLGGVGAITAELMARWGVKRFRLFDKDIYEPTNLNRQLYATTKTIGRYKVEVTAERLREINPWTEIEMMIKDRVCNENIYDFVEGLDLLIQTTDSPSSLLFYKAAEIKRVPVVNGYASLTGGFVTVFDYRHKCRPSLLERIKDFIKWRGLKKITQMTREELDALDEKWGIGTTPSINFITNMVGCLIVAEAVKLLTGRGRSIKYPKRIEFDVFEPHLKISKFGTIKEYLQRLANKKETNLIKNLQ